MTNANPAACGIVSVLDRGSAWKLHCTIYTNELHESLLKKEGAAFWKSWRSKFESTSKCTEVEGCLDQGVIADNFATHFSGCFTGNNRI